MTAKDRRRKARNWALGVAIAVVVGVVLWLDLRTSLWQEMVIVSGLVASFVTFLVTYLIIDRLLARAEARRWEPVTRLALTDILHALASEKHSEISRGVVVARKLPVPDGVDDPELLRDQLDRLGHSVVAERRRLTERLALWAGFLSASWDNSVIMQHVAETSLLLDTVRDAILEVEEDPSPARVATLRARVADSNTHLAALVTEIERRLDEHRDAALAKRS